MFWKKKNNDGPYVAALPGEKPDGGYLEVHSPTWKWVRKWAEDALNEARINNDHEFLDQNKTALIRGRIAVLKQLIDLPEEKGLLK